MLRGMLKVHVFNDISKGSKLQAIGCKGQLNRHTRYRPATTTRNTSTLRKGQLRRQNDTLTVGLTVHVMNRFKPGASCVIRVSVCPVCVLPVFFDVFLPVPSTINCRLHSKAALETRECGVGTLPKGQLNWGLFDRLLREKVSSERLGRPDVCARAPKRLPKRPRSRRSR